MEQQLADAELTVAGSSRRVAILDDENAALKVDSSIDEPLDFYGLTTLFPVVDRTLSGGVHGATDATDFGQELERHLGRRPGTGPVQGRGLQDAHRPTGGPARNLQGHRCQSNPYRALA